MKDILTKKDDISFELQAIQDFLEEDFTDDNPEIIQERGNMLTGYVARSGKILADAKYYRDEKTKDSIFQEIRDITKLSATTANKYIDSLCKEENYLVNWSERLNRAATHQLDWCRSVLSKQKEELRNSHYQNT
ncbi:hypothetical protein HZP82_15600 [Elizabethkingia anophelis]|nr:hypothetical protein [Elizabethkingia anophelis]MCT4106492.1 hypothetical protein [Elizabethkingia anophelis]MCT4181906.1 hypothetical protein [Elizabethkingia anophelis]